MAQDLVKRRQDGTRAIAQAVTDYLAASSTVSETLADLVSSGGNFVQADYDGTDLVDIDAAVMNYLRDVVWPNVQAAYAAPFDGTAGHESNLSMLRKLVRLGA